MQLISPSDAAGQVTAALKNAAQVTGAGFDYLLRTAKRESSLDPSAKAPTSSASGLFQFIDQTWLETLKEEGGKLGMADAAADVSKTASGKYTVADPSRRAEIMAMKNDPNASALLAGAFTRKNAQTLQSALGRPATDGELYAAHFLGAQGAVDLIKLAVEQPSANAADAFPAQASANRAIFYDKGRPRTAAEVYSKVAALPKAGDAPVAAAPVALALQTTSDDMNYGPFNGGVENDSKAFHSLFKTGRRTPVSAYVSQAWSSFGSAGLVSDTAAVKTAAVSAAQPIAAVARSQAVAPDAHVVKTMRVKPVASAAVQTQSAAETQAVATAAKKGTVSTTVVQQSSAGAAFTEMLSNLFSQTPFRKTELATPTPSPSASVQVARK